MKKEAYCSSEITKLLKEKGFNWSENKRPTQQIAVDWLRKKT